MPVPSFLSSESDSNQPEGCTLNGRKRAARFVQSTGFSLQTDTGIALIDFLVFLIRVYSRFIPLLRNLLRVLVPLW